MERKVTISTKSPELREFAGEDHHTMSQGLDVSMLCSRLAHNYVTPPHFRRQLLPAVLSSPFNVTLQFVDGIKCQSGDGDYHIRLSLFDLAYKQFFGRIWTSPALSTKKDGQSRLRLTVNQNVHFHTTINDESMAVVMEVMASYRSDAGKMAYRSCGWNFTRIFKYEGKMVDVSSTSMAPAQKMELYHGSPLALVFLDEPAEASSELKKIEGCKVVYTLRTHQYLCKIMHLVPENCIVGGRDVIPGLAEASRESKSAVPEPLRKPRLLKSLPCHIEKINVSFGAPLDKIEEDICRLLNEDRLQRDSASSGGTALQILKRQLTVGVHNGWMYVAEPVTVNLAALDSSSNVGFKRTSSKRGHKRTPSASSLGQASVLFHKNRIDLDGMLEDPSFAVVFTLMYDIAESSGAKDRKMSIAQTAFPVALRWAAWCPLANLGPQEHTIQLLGGPGINPEEMMLFQSPSADTIGSTASLSAITSGSITFSFHSDIKAKENQPISIMDAAGQMLQLPPNSARAGSRASFQTDASSVLHEVQVTGRPPLPPSGRPGTSQSHHDHLVVPPLQGLGGSPPQTGYMQQGVYPQASPMGPYGMPLPYTTTPRGYMPMEIQHLRESGGSYMGWAMGSARMGPDLQEMPFTPAHAPIMAVAPGMQSVQALSRAAYAKLYTAGFQPILDRHGEAAEVIDPNDVINFVPAKEDMDRLKANEIHLQFLAFARTMTFEAPGTNKQPSSVFFTFQFYRYPQVTTERLLLGNPEGQLGTDPHAIPCLLQKLDKDGTVLKGPPGYMLKYMVDPTYLKPGEGRLFVHHLSQQILHIDVWDGDSLHLIGSCPIELKNLCRQGREAVQVTYELDVVSQDIVDPEGAVPAGDMTRDGSMLPTTLNQSIRGRLHLRMASVGHFAESKKADTLPVAQKPKLVVNGQAGASFLGGSLHAVNNAVKALATMKVAKAAHLADTNHELAQVLFSRREEAKQEATGHEGGVDKKRKLSRMDFVRQSMGPDKNQMISSFRHDKDNRSRDLQTLEVFRNQGKREGILNMLNKAISMEHTIYPSLGVAEFFEYTLRNPYNVDHTVTVETEDPELIILTDPREWRHFKMMNELYTSVEEGMFNTESKSGKPEIFLRPKESVQVPFKFLTFKADHTVLPQTPSDPYKPQTKVGMMNKKSKRDPLQTRVIKVIFRSTEDKPISILSVKVEPQPHIIDQTFRFHQPEQSFLKKSIRLPPLHTLPGFPIGGPGLDQVWVKCSDHNVICTSRKVQPGEPHDIFLKVACGASPQVKKFFVAIYTDAYLSRPIQVWQFYTHAMQRVDVSCTEGQTSRFTLLLRGTQASRLVQCHPSHGGEMSINPKDPFMLAANSLQEVYVGVRPMSVGSKFLFINVVDIEYHQLVRSWLVCVTCQPSHVVKAYEIALHVGGGKSSNKKISYTNPYPAKKVFYLRTNREDLLQFKDTRLEVGPGESTSIGLRFAPSMSPGSIEILVFINDEDDKNEETFCVKANYQ